LGRGGYSEVYKAYDLENCKEVACKIHRFDDTWSRSMQANYIKHALRENQTHQKLNHPRIVRHYDTLEMDNNSFCTVLELCSGPDLSEYLKINGLIPEKEAKLIITQILSGLKYLNDHNPKIIHYDLKPQNILFHNGEIKISDFGLCKVIEDNTERVELTSQGVGTYWYQPPECFEVGPTPPLICSKVDVWSLGVIFYEMLYGIRPFGHDMTQQRILESRAILKNGKSLSFPSKPNVSNECKEFMKNCLAYYYPDRYSVEEAYSSEYIRPKK
jgi:tousled-like kinase